MKKVLTSGGKAVLVGGKAMVGDQSTGGSPPYTGEYTVVPKADEPTVLETKGKRMTDDVTVTKIPYYETANPLGDTVYIAAEV